jgi:hypothetical protein
MQNTQITLLIVMDSMICLVPSCNTASTLLQNTWSILTEADFETLVAPLLKKLRY